MIESVRGVVIGDITKDAILVYEGRQQGKSFSAKTDEELKQIANNMIAEFKTNKAFKLIYPNKESWEMRIFD